MYSELIKHYQEKDELGRLVIIDLLDEIIEFSPKYRRFKDATYKKVQEGKTNYIFPIAAKEGFEVNGITFYSKRIRFNKGLREYLAGGDQSVYYNIIRRERFIFLDLLAQAGLIQIFNFSEDAKKEIESTEMEQLYSVKGEKVYFDLPKFRFYEKGFSLDEKETFLINNETKPLYLLAKETEKIIESQGRNSLAEMGRKGTFLEELECTEYICDNKKLYALRADLRGSSELAIMTKCVFGGGSLYINGNEILLAEKSHLFLKLLADYFESNETATEVNQSQLLNFYRKNKDKHARINIQKLTYKNIKNGYFDTLKTYIKKHYIFEEILTIEQIEKSFIIKKEKSFR